MKCFTALILLLALATGASAQSIHTLPQGTKLSGTVEFGMFRLPLPPGEWTLIGAARQVATSLNGGMSPPTGAAFLALIEKGSLVAIVEASGSIDPQRVEWTPDAECRRDDLWFLEADRNFRNSDQTCRLVSHATRAWNAGTDWPAYLKQAMQWLQDNKIRRPQQMLRAKFRRVSYGDFLSVTYSVNPEHFGQARSVSAAWSSSDWHKVNYPDQPARKAFAEAWLQWSEAMAPVFIDGFKKNAGVAAPAFPFFAPQRASAPTVVGATGRLPVVGTRIETGGGSFTITQVEGMKVYTVNRSGQSAVWQPGGLLPLGARAQFDRRVAESIFPLAIGKEVSFEQTTEGSSDRWAQTLEVVGTEKVQVGETTLETFVVKNRTESLNPSQGDIVRIRTLWFAPDLGWLVRVRSEQLSGPPMQLNDWYAVRVVPPS